MKMIALTEENENLRRSRRPLFNIMVKTGDSSSR